MVVEEDRVASFCMQLQAMEFMAKQEQLRVKKYEKRRLSRPGASPIRWRRYRESRGYPERL